MWANFQKFLNRPFDNDMTAVDWFLFIGLLIAISVAWRFILKHIMEWAE